MKLPSKSRSLWMATVPTTAYPKLTPGTRVDVAILGGGIAGLMTAYFLKQAGKKVAIIEARRIASGTTGHTTAHLSIAHELVYHELIANFGKEKALDYAQANQEGIELVEKISRLEKIDCDFAPANEYIFDPAGTSGDSVKREYEATKSLGLRTEFLTSAPLPFKTGAAIRYSRQAQFHPRKFLVQLAQKIDGGGSYVFEQTRALDVIEGEPMTVKTDKGGLVADDVVIATLYPFLDRGLYFARLNVYTSYVLAVLTDSEFPPDLFDSTEERSHYFRRQPYKNDFIVLVGGEGHRTGEISDTDKQYQKLEQYARQYLKIRAIKYRWSTHDTYAVDNVPYIGKYLPHSEHLYVATGFKGWGMAHGVIGGKLICELITRKPNRYAELFNPSRVKPKASVKNLVELTAKVAKLYLQSKLAKKSQLDLAQLLPGEWKIYQINGQKAAVYRDLAGKAHVVSAYCQHQGCTIRFNQAEKTWDCPCHGSRYALDGEVLYGPTVRGLPKIKE